MGLRKRFKELKQELSLQIVPDKLTKKAIEGFKKLLKKKES